MPGKYRPLAIGTPVSFKYRSATPEGRIVGVVKRGATPEATEYSVRPRKQDRHPGEPTTVHRHGDKVRKISHLSKD